MNTLEEAKAYLRANWEKGVACPCCTQRVCLNKYPFHHSMARVLIFMFNAEKRGRHDKEGFLHVEDYLVEIGSKIKGVVGKMKYWDLVEHKANDDKTKKESGLWKITEKGRNFVLKRTTIPHKAFVFKDKVYGFSSMEINIVEALGIKFNYEELLNNE